MIWWQDVVWCLVTGKECEKKGKNSSEKQRGLWWMCHFTWSLPSECLVIMLKKKRFAVELFICWSLMAKWLGRASQGYQMYYHNLEVMGLNFDGLNLGCIVFLFNPLLNLKKKKEKEKERMVWKRGKCPLSAWFLITGIVSMTLKCKLGNNMIKKGIWYSCMVCLIMPVV